MDSSPPVSWFSDLEMDAHYDLFPTLCHLNCVDDDQFISQDIASTVLLGQYSQPSLSCESYSSHNSCTTAETNHCWSSTISDPSSSSQLVSFDHSINSSSPTLKPNNEESSGIQYFSVQSLNGFSQSHNFEAKSKSSQGINRPVPHVSDHIMAERKRREKLSQSFIALSALVPGLKKMDKASVLGDAIKYVKELKERLSFLEEQNKKRRVESVVTCEKLESVGEEEGPWLPEVEARVLEKEVLIRIHCQKQKGLLVKILAEIQKLNLFAVNSSVLPFGDSNLDVTIVAQMGEGCSLTIRDLVKNLRVAILSACEM
ncbi:transcription factor bHLH18-like [Prosopis cineraria]|uniref:transcription factor bHLH18-like n=1 Tax=Prosopis cineraria TaxID=364024 RepID=UPI0024109E6E|nr:transcription factor bHLH18-like [Prosopis cineraria]